MRNLSLTNCVRYGKLPFEEQNICRFWFCMSAFCCEVLDTAQVSMDVTLPCNNYYCHLTTPLHYLLLSFVFCLLVYQEGHYKLYCFVHSFLGAFSNECRRQLAAATSPLATTLLIPDGFSSNIIPRTLTGIHRVPLWLQSDKTTRTRRPTDRSRWIILRFRNLSRHLRRQSKYTSYVEHISPKIVQFTSQSQQTRQNQRSQSNSWRSKHNVTPQRCDMHGVIMIKTQT
jgi:hypothetical protein